MRSSRANRVNSGSSSSCGGRSHGLHQTHRPRRAPSSLPYTSEAGRGAGGADTPRPVTSSSLRARPLLPLLLLLLLLLSLAASSAGTVVPPLLEILARHTGDCSVLTFSNEDAAPWLRDLNGRQFSSMNFQFESELGAGQLPAPPPNTNYYAEVLRLPCLTHVFWGNISSLIGRTLRAVEEQKTVVIRREYFLLHDTTGAPAADLFGPLRDRPNVAVISERADGTAHVTVRCLYCDAGGPRLQRAGHWSPEQGLQLLRPLFADQFADFHGHRLTCSVLPFVPFVDYEETEDGRLIPQPSIDFNALQVMAAKWNFTYGIKKPSDLSWGVQRPNGSWTGIMGELAEDSETDFTLVLTMLHKRVATIRFTRIYAIDTFVFVTGLAQPIPQWLSIFRPFRMTLWIVTIVSVLLAGMAAFGFTRFHPLPERRFTISLSILNTYGAMCENAQSRVPSHSTAAKTFLGWWWLYCIIILTAYKSSLVAMMTVPSLSENINTLEALAESSFSWGLSDGFGSDFTLFQTSPVSIYQQLFAKMQFHNTSVSFRKLLNERYAYISWKSNLDTVIAERYSDQRGQPLVHMSRETFSPENYGWGFRPSAPYVHKFDSLMQQLVEAGLITKWEHDTRERRASLGRDRRPASRGPDPTRFVAISVYHLQGAFMLLSAGFAAGLVALLTEVLVHRARSKAARWRWQRLAARRRAALAWRSAPPRTTSGE
ncbi:glutamate receptor ionotropic, kainate 4-like [Amphibalanus amphitrite]|uniref:glutamate receptor ionotropic, kainate 4-like n=1 Tax=Amphibalanus amphitrite TaxID=1232801 RepID=UPI001C9187DF|nr:glutamate receptor ionotropic, kainate 4-like [Amphibalanus amphitrite]